MAIIATDSSQSVGVHVHPHSAVSRIADRMFTGMVTAIAASIVLLTAIILVLLWMNSGQARDAFGFSFLTNMTWDPVSGQFGALPFVFGTLVSSVLALLIGAPLGIGTAMFLAELAPVRLRLPLSFLVEMLASIPSVVFGLWAIFVLVPIVRGGVEPVLGQSLGSFIPLFSGPPYGVGILSAGLILAIMILPTIAAISRDVLSAVPREQREGYLALGSTRWEMISTVVLPYARAGIMGSCILGLGRAIGETMAVTMVIGNRPQISPSLFSLASTMASVIANQFTEAANALYLSALVEIGLLLFFISLLMNVLARLLIWRIQGDLGSQVAG